MAQTKERKLTHKVFSIEVTKQFFEQLEDAAKNKNMNRSEFVRDCIRKQIS